MKITKTLGNTSSLTETLYKDEKRSTGSSELSFWSNLKRVESRNYEVRIKELADSIARQGEKLGKNIDIMELMVYKKLISEFLGEVVSDSYRFFKRSFLDRRGRHRVYAIIKKINEELDLLTKEVLSEQKDNIRILQRLDDIRGLIMDILM
ncbi:MAG TPA: YaaR family protein [Clostridiaceae bacterium]|nr:YaaR family protein [Clostridiaceae bacterium]